LSKEIILNKFPISFEEYADKFNIVQKNIKIGNSYLLNLTAPTEIKINLSLEDIYLYSKARYKIFYKDRFVCFSPETFMKINNGKITSYPMKGTIEASVPNAEAKILNDPKETAEHYTIVDLIRNDLSIVARNIKVEKFRYIDVIKTNVKELLQVSSIISGDLEENYNNRIGDIVFALLPAGSITGAPKKKTIEIILEAEKYERGYYTGVCGIFDGINLDSCVMIRFIEQTGDKLIYKSGGGITAFSDVLSEYNELTDKVYAPID